MGESKVAIIKGERGLEPVYQALDLIPFEETLEPWDTVLIKVNLITSHTYETGITTDPIVVEALINRVKALDKRAVVVETEGGITSPDKALVETGIMVVRTSQRQYSQTLFIFQHGNDITSLLLDISAPSG